jgi:hypothetical protein
LGDPEGRGKKMVSQIFWDKNKKNWILVAYDKKGNLKYIEEYGDA